MANIFLDSTAGNDSNDGSTRALAKATLAAALTAAGAGGRVGVRATHAETQTGTMSLTSPGTAASPTQVLCIDWSSDTLASNAITSGATVSVSSSNNMAFEGFAYSVGVAYQVTGTGSGDMVFFTAANPGYWRIENGALNLLSTSTSALIVVGTRNAGTNGTLLELVSSNLRFGHVDQTFHVRARVNWSGGSVNASGSAPTILFTPDAEGEPGRLHVCGVDLSHLGSGKSLVDASGDANNSFRFENCKLGSSVSLVTGTIPNQGSLDIDMVNCDSADTNVRYQRSRYQGTITQETTIVRTGGASDGTTPISRKLVSTANAKFQSPLFFTVMFWNDGTSALSLAAEVVSDGVTFTDAELWMEVEALTNSGFPFASFTHDRATTVLTAAANQTTSSVTWTTTGLSSPTKQKLEVSVTPAEKGWIRCRIYLAKASSTVYVCPLITGLGFTSGRQWQGEDAYVIEGAGGGSSGKPSFGPGEMFRSAA